MSDIGLWSERLEIVAATEVVSNGRSERGAESGCAAGPNQQPAPSPPLHVYVVPRSTAAVAAAAALVDLFFLFPFVSNALNVMSFSLSLSYENDEMGMTPMVDVKVMPKPQCCPWFQRFVLLC